MNYNNGYYIINSIYVIDTTVILSQYYRVIKIIQQRMHISSSYEQKMLIKVNSIDCLPQFITVLQFLIFYYFKILVMGTICERQTQSHPQNSINENILTLIKVEANKYKQSCTWPDQLLKNINYVPHRELFQKAYLEQTKKFIKNNMDKQIYSGIQLNEQKIKFKMEIQSSSLMLQNQLSGPMTTPTTKKQMIQSQRSFFLKQQLDKSLIMQIDLTFKTEFLYEKEYYRPAKKFIRWMLLAEGHFKRKFLRFAYQSFEESMQKQIDRIKTEKLIDILDSITFQTNKFISMITLIYIQVYYLKQIQAQQNGNLFKNQNIYNFIMKIIFKTTSMSQNMYNIIKLKISRNIDIFRQKLQQLDKKPIQFFQIQKEFLLIDRDTSDTQRKELYSECIIELRRIKNKPTPIGKLKIIILVSKLMKQLIQKFYQRKKSIPPPLQPEAINSIIIYIIVKSKYEDLMVDLEIIENFTSRNCMNCISGYYLNVFKAAIQLIMTSK